MAGDALAPFEAAARAGGAGNTALHMAAHAGDVAAVRLAARFPERGRSGGRLAEGADLGMLLRARNSHGDTPLMFACTSGSLGGAAALLRAAGNAGAALVSERNEEGMTPLICCALAPEATGAHCAKMILSFFAPREAGDAAAAPADMDLVDRHGNTAMHYAARAGNVALVRLLLGVVGGVGASGRGGGSPAQRCRSPFLVNAAGRTPLEEARSGDCSQAVTLLEEFVAKENEDALARQQELLAGEEAVGRCAARQAPGGGAVRRGGRSPPQAKKKGSGKQPTNGPVRATKLQTEPGEGGGTGAVGGVEGAIGKRRDNGGDGDGECVAAASRTAQNGPSPLPPPRAGTAPTVKAGSTTSGSWAATVSGEWTIVSARRARRAAPQSEVSPKEEGRNAAASRANGAVITQAKANSIVHCEGSTTCSRRGNSQGVEEEAGPLTQHWAAALQRKFDLSYPETQCLGIELKDVVEILCRQGPSRLSSSQLDAVECVLKQGLDAITQIRLEYATQLGRETLVEELRVKAGWSHSSVHEDV